MKLLNYYTTIIIKVRSWSIWSIGIGAARAEDSLPVMVETVFKRNVERKRKQNPAGSKSRTHSKVTTTQQNIVTTPVTTPLFEFLAAAVAVSSRKSAIAGFCHQRHQVWWWKVASLLQNTAERESRCVAFRGPRRISDDDLLALLVVTLLITSVTYCNYMIIM